MQRVQIDTRPLGRSGLAVSAVGMGCVKLGSISSGQGRRAAVRLVHEAVDAGLRFFDTADAYGSGLSESVLGEALDGIDDVVVATKVGYRFEERTAAAQIVRAVGSTITRRLPLGRSPRRTTASYAAQDFSTEYVRDAVQGSLRRLRRERLDLLQFHGPPAADASDLPEVAQQLLDDGMVGAFGIGSESLDVASSWVQVPGVASIQLAVGVLDPEAVTTVIPQARSLGVGVVARGVLGGGVLARALRGAPTGLEPARSARVDDLKLCASRYGADLMQLAMWYALDRVGADAVLVGISSTEQLAGVMRMLGRPAPSDAVAEIVAIVEGRV